MHIVLFHHALIPPPKYGGTERLIFWLAEALVSLGHRITLIAKEGSKIPGVTVLPIAEGDLKHWEKYVPKDADILHLWNTPTPPPKKPFIVTIGGNGKPGESFDPHTVFVSEKHAALHGSTHFVHNGINPDHYEIEPNPEKRANYLVFLAKANWKVKNLAGAIEIAKASKLPLEVLGSRDWPLGLHRLVQGFLGGLTGIRYRGMVGDVEKRQILKYARALLFPVLWNEPFGLAITESLASGCPVFGTPYGSLPEIVTPSVGRLSDSSAVLIESLKTEAFLPMTCRKRVFEGFTHLKMAEKYLKYYRNVLEKGSLSGLPQDVTPRTLGTNAPETLLPWKTT